ncbi:MAG: hypothetical protein ACO1N0_11135 [Fluviicola sp.]
MFSKICILLFPVFITPSFLNAQVYYKDSMDSVIFKILQVLAEQRSDSSYRSFTVTDNVLTRFLKAHPECYDQSMQLDTVNFPRIKFAMSGDFVVQMELSLTHKIENICFQLIHESLVSLETIHQKYVMPSAMSSCSGGIYRSTSLKYYQQNRAIKTFDSTDPCFDSSIKSVPMNLDGIQYPLEHLNRWLDFIHALHQFILAAE